MWIYVTWIIFVPTIIILTLYTTKEFIIIVGEYKLSKANKIDNENYNKLKLIEQKPDYRIPRGQTAYFVFDVPNMKMGQKQRKYTGSTKSNIKLPFMRLSLQNREFFDTHQYSDWGPVKVTLTNKLIRVVAQQDSPIKREFNIIDIEEIKLAEDNKTVHFSTRRSAWPLRLQFKNKVQAENFQNAFWTLLYEFSRVSKSTIKEAGND